MTKDSPNLNQIYRMFSSPNEPFKSNIGQMIIKATLDKVLSKPAANERSISALTDICRNDSLLLAQLWQPELSELLWGDHSRSSNSNNAELNTPVKLSTDPVLPRQTVDLEHEVVFNNHPSAHHTQMTKGFPFEVSEQGWNPQLWVDTVEFMQTVAPEYAQWAQRLLTVIIPIESEQGHQISASRRHRWGEVAMSWRVRPEQMAEMMIHEASHQHYFLASMLSAFDDGSDQTLYYSPVVKKERPISKILLAYHAFANVILFYRKAHEALGTTERQWLVKETKKISAELAQLETPLRNTSALTPLGKALWQPLAAQLKETL